MLSKRQYIYIIAIVCLLIVSFLLGKCTRTTADSAIRQNSQIDTLYIHDTLRLIDTVLQKQVVKRTVRDTIHIPDTLIIRDTLFTGIAAIRESLTYTDSSTYRAVVSGVKPSLDSLELWRTTQIVTIPTINKQSPWGIGITAGVGWGGGKPKPAISVGITYNIIRNL